MYNIDTHLYGFSVYVYFCYSDNIVDGYTFTPSDQYNNEIISVGYRIGKGGGGGVVILVPKSDSGGATNIGF